MKTFLTLFIAVCSFVSLVWVYAQSEELQDVRDEYKEDRRDQREWLQERKQQHRSEARVWRETMRQEHGMFHSFLQEDLTDEEKASIRTTMKERHYEVKAAVKEFLQEFTTESDTVEDDVAIFVAGLIDGETDVHANLEIYVKEEAVNDGSRDEFVQAHKDHFEKHMTQRILYALEWKSLRQQRSLTRNHRLTWNQKMLIGKKLWELWEDDVAAFFGKILERIDTKVGEVEENDELTENTKTRLVDLLSEIADVIENELDIVEIEEDIDDAEEDELSSI